MGWTKEYCDLSHLMKGAYNNRELWVTVRRFDDCAKLLEWFPGCVYSPKETWYNSVDEAKRAGEKIMGIQRKKRTKVKF